MNFITKNDFGEIFFVKEICDEYRKGAKKYFFYDLAYNNILLSENLGQRFENAIFGELQKNFEEIIYRKNNFYEIDFIIPEKNIGIQVCYDLNDENIKREIKGFQNSDFEKKYLIYFEKERDYKIEGVEVLNFYEFVLELGNKI